MWALRALLIALVFVAAVAFAYSNVGIVVDVNLQPVYSDMADVPLISVVGWALGIGLFLSLLMFISTYIKLSVQIRAARKRIKALETEVAILRNRPIEESADLLKGADGESDDQRSAFSES
ncbi:LapA family protein [bacterium]|nr:LapA family protein [bacterium]MCB2201617.1 LapA family protein [bacterium]